MGNESPKTFEATAPNQGLRVLLVEDSPANVLVAKANLEVHGCDVTVAEDGQAGIEAFSNGAFDVVLMDIQMPRLDGYQATRLIRETCAGNAIPIVAVTAGRAAVNRNQALDAGMDDFVEKPVDWSALIDLIGHMTKHR